jgi:hypothetical protein
MSILGKLGGKYNIINYSKKILMQIWVKKSLKNYSIF